MHLYKPLELRLLPLAAHSARHKREACEIKVTDACGKLLAADVASADASRKRRKSPLGG